MDEDEALAALARAEGIETEWWDWQGRPRRVCRDTLRALLAALGCDPTRPHEALDARSGPRSLPALLTARTGEPLRLAVPDPTSQTIAWRIVLDSGERASGRAEVTAEEGGYFVSIPTPRALGEGAIALGGAIDGETRIALCPSACFLGPLERERLWGLAVQVYGLRAPGDGGLGHYGALGAAARAAAQAGADALMLSPTHALFAADPAHVSPYSPSSRAQADGRLVDPNALPEVAQLAELVAATGLAVELAALEALPLVDYRRAVPARLALLRALFERFTAACPRGTSLAEEFAAFAREGGEPLRRHAVFEALHAERFGADPAQWDWRSWPASFRDPTHPDVERFARERAQEISFHLFLQWLAERGLASAQRAARRAGMRIGLIADLAVGQHPGGSRAWARAGALLQGVTIGAPPDALNHRGQGWGLTTFAPRALAAAGFAPFREELRAAMRHAGGIRLDHVMGLSRIWCIPEGARPDQG
ncbi:MAG: 4-alpha-glucanotransferase, partial [Elioraea sp.]|nr:4-alpha-glucanotransferase [Elioraea sp.]